MSRSGQPRLILARGILLRASQLGSLVLDGGLLVVEGRVQRVVDGPRAVQRLRSAGGVEVEDLGDVLLLPGLVNAHAHLELTGMQGELPRDEGFGPWVGALLRAKAERGLLGMAEDAAKGLAQTLAAGVTTVGDVASLPATLTAMMGSRLSRPRVRLYREVLDAWDPSRTQAALESLAEPLGETEALYEGYSPHAPFTVSRGLLDGLAQIHAQRSRPVSMHWAETQAELDWMDSGSGEFAGVLGQSPHRSGLDLLEAAGLLGSTTSLVHGNLPGPGEIERIAAAGASVIHCPGTHGFFGRGEFPLARYEAAGVNLALGTDSLASNDTLDLAQEARRLLLSQPSLPPGRVLSMATEGGAQALDLARTQGCLEPGYWADAFALSLPDSSGTWPQTSDQAAEYMLTQAPGIEAVLLGGQPAC